MIPRKSVQWVQSCSVRTDGEIRQRQLSFPAILRTGLKRVGINGVGRRNTLAVDIIT